MSKVYTGNKKRAGKEFGEIKNKTQYCIDGVLVDEVLDNLPTGIEIIGCKIRIGTHLMQQKGIVPNNLRKYGCTYMRHSLPSTSAEITLDAVNPKQIKTSVGKVAESIGADPEKAYFQYIVLSNGESAGKFQRTTKEIHPDERDLRKKAVVLGLTDGQGKVQGLIRDIGAKNFKCSWEEVTVRMVTCSAK
jgi:hypothetical protein